MLRALIFVPFLFTGYQDQEKSPHAKVYDKIVDSVVGIMARNALGDYTGTGVIISEDGYILTSSTIVMKSTDKENLRVWVHGPKKYESSKEIKLKDGVKIREVEIVGVSKDEEIAIIKIHPKQKLKPIKFGNSGKIKVGEVVYAVGNAGAMIKTITDNDQATFQMGLLSGFYRLKETKQASSFKGYLFETTALFNPKMEGGPLVSTKGEMIGLLTPNYSPHRFVGHAIPVNVFKKRIKFIIEEYKKKKSATEISNLNVKGYSGIQVKDKDGKVVISKVEKASPADKKGLMAGDTILKLGNKTIKSSKDFDEFIKDMKVGSILRIMLDIDGFKTQVQIKLIEKK